MKKVVIIQRNIPHYRKPFFESLRKRLEECDIDLCVIYGSKAHDHLLIDAPDWALYRPLYWFGKMSWHRTWSQVFNADLVIVPQEVKCLSNLTHYVVSRITTQKFAYWGHGKNFQATSPNSLVERFKKILSRRVDWWFAYNDLSAGIVRQLNYPRSRITILQNTVDTKKLQEIKARISIDSLKDLKFNLGIKSNNIAVFTGGFSDYKRLDFLLNSAVIIRESIPDFELLIIGDGPNRRSVELADAKFTWVRWLGKMDDEEKVPYWLLAKFVAMPGLVGLVVVDSLALGVPMISSAYPYHSPEVDYLKNGVNGLIEQNWTSEEAYAKTCIDYLKDSELQQQLKYGCEESVMALSIETMAQNMVDGIESLLGLKS